MTAPFTPDVRAAARRRVLCWFATADAAGQPNVTPSDPALARWVAALRAYGVVRVDGGGGA